MSIIPVLEPSKGSKITYLATSTLIVIVLTILLFSFLQIDLQLTIVEGEMVLPLVNYLPYLIPIASLLAIIFAGVEPEKWTIERWLVWKLLYSSNADENWVKRIKIRIIGNNNSMRIKLNMTLFLFFTRPWEGSRRIAGTIEETLYDEYKRTVNGPEFQDPISDYHTTFWTILLTPISLYIMGLFIPFMWDLWLAGFILGPLITYPFRRKNQSLVKRIEDYSFTKWVFELITIDLSQRSKRIIPISDELQMNQNNIRDIAKAVLDLVRRKDWRGFDRNSGNVAAQIPFPINDRLSLNQVDELTSLYMWCLNQDLGPFFSIAANSINNSHVQISDALKIFFDNQKLIGPEDSLILDTLEHMTTTFTDLTSLREINADFYESLRPSLLNEITQSNLGIIPFLIAKTKPMATSGSMNSYDRMACNLVAAGEKGLLDAKKILEVLSSWKVPLANIIGFFDEESIKYLFENDIGYTPTEIGESRGRIMHLLDSYPNSFDLAKVWETLEKHIDTYTKQDVLTFLRRMLHGIPMTRIETPQNIRQVLIKFIHEHDDSFKSLRSET